jgi:cytochrome P450
MEFLLPPPITVLPSIFAVLLFLYYFHKKYTNTTNKRSPPEAGGAWPLIGHLRLLAGTEPTHKVLGALADKHGPIFTIRLGVHRALVLSNSEIAKECFTGSNDKAFSNRPKSIAVEHLSYNYANFGFSPYGPYWREMRKITMLELLSNHRLSMLRHVRESVVKNSVKSAYEIWVRQGICLVEMKKWFDEITLELTVRIIAGSAKKEVDNSFREAFREFFYLMGVVTVADAIPFLRWLDLGGYENKMKKTAKKLDDMLQGWLDEHKQRRSSSEATEAETEKDFMDVMLDILAGGTNEALSFDADIINKATCLGLTLGGTDTTTTTLTWAVALLLNNPRVLKKAQAELDTHVGRQRQVEESDIKNLVYIQAITKETLRLYAPAQLLPPRESTEDCIVGGYHVAAGTRLFVNLWKIHRDPRVWPEPGEFRPERFLTTHKDVDLKGKHFELMPFGSGRRVCPGISFALQVVQFTLASLVHAFEITTQVNEHVDMTESFGFSNVKAIPVEVLLTPRLCSELYG